MLSDILKLSSWKDYLPKLLIYFKLIFLYQIVKIESAYTMYTKVLIDTMRLKMHSLHVNAMSCVLF